MITLSSFSRRLIRDARSVEVELAAGAVRWLDAQEHAGENIGDAETRAIFVELKEPGSSGAEDEAAPAPLGPSEG
jgi:hypothetical protein